MRALAAYSGIGVRTLRDLLHHAAHPLPHYRVGGKLLVRRTEFDEWIRRFRIEEPSTVAAIVDDVLRSL